MIKKVLIENAVDFIENANIGIHTVSPEGIIKYANEHELKVLGYTEEEYVGHHVSEFQFDKSCLEPVSYTHLTLPTTPYV